jgi:8-oxo-dGTP diphosphatase
LREAALRELREETGVVEVELGALAGVYSAPDRDRRFHAVTVLVHATVGVPTAPPANPIEIASVGLFSDDELPAELSHGMTGMLADVRACATSWE